LCPPRNVLARLGNSGLSLLGAPIEQPKSHGRDGEEVHRCYCLPMVLQKREPLFRGFWISRSHDVAIFEDFGNGRTKLTFIRNEAMENAKNSGQ